MRLKSVELAGFRCFGSSPVRLTLSSDLTAIVGNNASGKTALLHGISILFGVSQTQRLLQRSDFHLPPNVDPENRSSRELTLDALIEFPELLTRAATPETVAPVFQHMLIDKPHEPPLCRIRLEARWEDDGTIDGEVSQDLYWVTTLANAPPDDTKHRILPADRGLIQLIYMPATRDPVVQVRATTGAMAARLLRAIQWSESTREAIDAATNALSAAFRGDSAIEAIRDALGDRWSGFHDHDVDTNPGLSLLSKRFEEVVNRISVTFQDGPEGFERGLEALSEGQQSLFYFALSAAIFDLERRVVARTITGFSPDQIRIPALTVFAIEEPENHLSPYYLARIVQELRSVSQDLGAQAIVTSHSPAVLARVRPYEVRHCRRESTTRTSFVRSVVIPEDHTHASKFVLGAMQAFPELYFSRFVVLVEGDSERVVLPRLARALGLLIDPSFVAVVPIGGRHVQHFWRLLNQLDIPHATLMDLDLGRRGGGFGRIKTAIQHLLDYGGSPESLLKLPGGDRLSEEQLHGMHEWQNPYHHERLLRWAKKLREHRVFFSCPLDFDLMMLASFPEAYRALQNVHGGPRMSVESAAKAAFGNDAPGIDMYRDQFSCYRVHLPGYRYHFLTRSKLATHMAAIAQMSDNDIVDSLPEPLHSLLQYVDANINTN